MPVLPAPTSPTHSMDGVAFTSLATPSLGSNDVSLWTVEMPPGTPGTPHSLTREEVFVVLDGEASVGIDGERTTARSGDVILVPAGRSLDLANESDCTLRLLCCLPVGGQALLADGTVLTPPWAQ